MTRNERIQAGQIQCSNCRKWKPIEQFEKHDSIRYSCSCGVIFHPDWKRIEKEAYKEFMRNG